MLMRNKCAAVLTSVGFLGLVMSTFLIPATAKATGKTSTGSNRVITVAISSGPQLQLLAEHQNSARPSNIAHQQSLICRNVFRLSFADLGFACQSPPASLALALD